jgi:hypothetical protein
VEQGGEDRGVEQQRTRRGDRGEWRDYARVDVVLGHPLSCAEC